MKGNFISYFTSPIEDWLLGIEYIPLMTMDDDEKTFYSVLSFGLLFFRIDYIKKVEEYGS